ncbi:MAG TPA: family 20 glycosylhydrolase, partial [Jatrophihabitantaceae bacterium]
MIDSAQRRISRWRVAGLAGLVVVAVAVPIQGADAEPAEPAGPPAGASVGAPNAAPAVVPALQQWSGGPGSFRLRPGSRIVVARTDSNLAGDARTFSADVAAITGLDLPVVVSDRPHPGDFYLTRQAGTHPDGWYRLSIDDVATIQAPTPTGVFYGEQTVEQLLKTGDELPRGTAIDWPKQAERGFMLDLGRHYYTPAYVENQIREAAWTKLNVVHLHLTEASAFRLNSPKFPGLAAPQSYSHADISAFEAVAAHYHVTLVPEIDLPAHATPITDHWPQTTWDCAPMNDERGRNFTVDITKPATRDVVRRLLDEFIPWFKGPWFHIGADEYPYQSTQQQCPELVDYAKAHHLGSTSDVFVGFIDYLNSIVRAHGKTSIAWGWWDYDATPTIEPDKNIVVEAYGDDVEAGGAAGVHHFLDQGYQVLYANGHQLYATPGLNLLPDDQALYSGWPEVDGVQGYLFSRWADNEENQPDAYFDWYAERPQAVLADRTWGGPPLGTVFAFEDRVDRIGAAPGVPESGDPDAVALHGTPYGSSPPFDPSNSYDKADDGDVTTFFDYSQPDGGYTGIDLGAGSAATVTKIRFVPRANQPGRMTGGHFQGCTDGPASGCHDLATVAWSPTYDWHQLTVTDPARYRWLRYVSPDNGFGNVAEIQYYTAPVTAGRVAVTAPATLKPLDSYTLTTRFTNVASSPLRDVRLTLQGDSLTDQSPLRATPVGAATFAAVGPNRTVSVTWRVRVPLGATPGRYDVVGRAAYRTERGQQSARTVVPSTVVAPITARLDPDHITPAAGGTATSTLTVTDNLDQSIGLSWAAGPAPNITLPGPSTMLLRPGATATSTITVAAGEDALGVTAVPIHLRLHAGGQTAYGG